MTLEVLGWVVSVVVGFLLSEVRQRWQDKRERQTVVQGLSSEIEQNAKVTETIEARYSGRDLKNMINGPDLSTMSNDRWHDSHGEGASTARRVGRGTAKLLREAPDPSNLAELC